MKNFVSEALLIGMSIYLGLLHVSNSIDRVADALANVQVNMTTTVRVADEAAGHGAP